jgi:hypothetical protein
MNPKSSWLWILAAAGLLALILFHQKHPRKTATGPPRVLPELKASLVTSLQAKPAGGLEIRAERTNGAWRLTSPVIYPAQSEKIERLLAALEKLAPITSIGPAELKGRPNFEEEFGLTPEQSSLFVAQGDYRAQLKIGTKTAPGDQVFLQIAGKQNVFVADASLLNLIPATANDWRDRTLIDLQKVAFDRVSVTNGATFFQIERDPANNVWRLISPNQARANSVRIEDSLESLQRVRISRFLPDEPKPDPEALGLQPPEWQLAFAQNTQTVALIQFGKSPTNDAHQVYARLADRQTIVSAPNDLIALWRGSVNDFRDPHLLTLTTPVNEIEVRGLDTFSLLRQPDDSWRLLPQSFAADPQLVKDLLSSLTEMQVTRFVKDVVIEPDLPIYGLATPARKYILRSAAASSANGSNGIIAELHFGTNQDDKIFARRSDENSVYAVGRADVERLPSASWQIRERQIWDRNIEDVASVTIRQNGKVRQILHKGDRSWALAPGSQGNIEDLVVDETVRDLCKLTAHAWIAKGAEHRAEYHFETDGPQITLDLKNGDKLAVELGGESTLGLSCGAVCLDEELWIFDFNPSLHRDMVGCLTIPKNLP